MTQPTGDGERPQSYAEKDRGTPYGRPEAPPPPPKTSRTPLAIALVAVIAIVVAGTAIVLRATSPGTTSLVPGPAGLASRSPGSPATARPTATPAPSPDTGAAVLAAFWSRVSAPDLSYHLTGVGTTTLDGKTVQHYSESLNVVGDTYSGTLTTKERGTVTIARKDGVIWVKLPGKPRAGRQTDLRYGRLTPFLYLNMAAWLDDVGPVTVKGRRLELLRSNRYYRPDIARMLDLAKFPWEPDTMVLDVYVTGDGVPVSATFKLDVSVDDSMGSHRIHARTDFTFSKVGAKLSIAVPKR